MWCFLLKFGVYTVDFDMDSCVLASFLFVRLRGRLPHLFCCFSGQVLQLKHAQPATSDFNEILQLGLSLFGTRSYRYNSCEVSLGFVCQVLFFMRQFYRHMISVKLSNQLE